MDFSASGEPEPGEFFKNRLPSRPYCCDDLDTGLRIRPARQAQSKRYIQPNPPWSRSWLVFDIDRPGAAMEWYDVDLPSPTWICVNPDNMHAHLAWGLHKPVMLGYHDRQAPMRYMAAVEAAMRSKLEADPGYSGLVAKNPLHQDWRILWGRRLYDLPELHDYLDLPKYVPKRQPEEEAGMGRNVSTFDYLRFSAYSQVRQWKKSGAGYVNWLNWLYQTALDHTQTYHSPPLDHREVYHIAKSVVHWTWTRFDVEASDRRWSARQAARGRKSGEARRRATEQQRATARLMAAGGDSTRQIAAALDVTDRTIRNWLKE